LTRFGLQSAQSKDVFFFGSKAEQRKRDVFLAQAVKAERDIAGFLIYFLAHTRKVISFIDNISPLTTAFITLIS
jgi:hypothetical protein